MSKQKRCSGSRQAVAIQLDVLRSAEASQAAGLRRSLRSATASLWFGLLMLACALVSSPVSAGVALLQDWTTVYALDAYPPSGPLPAAYPIVSGTNRLLVVAIASSPTADGAQTYTVTWGDGTPTALTRANGTEGIGALRPHTAIYYLTDSQITAEGGSTLSVTVTGGTAQRTVVYAAVYRGVDQATPIADTGNSSDNSDDNSADGYVAPDDLSITPGELAIEVVNLHNSVDATVRTISTFGGGWAPRLGPNGSGAGGQAVSAYVNVGTAGVNSGHVVSGGGATQARHSRTGVVLNWDGSFYEPGPAQDGDVTLTGTFALNSYTTLSAAAGAGSTLFSVTSTAALALPACAGACSNTSATAGNGFGTALAQGDLLMIYQPQELGATITTTDDTTFGAHSGAAGYGQAGLYEFVYVSLVAGPTIFIDTVAGGAGCTGLKKSYDSGAMVIRVPQLRNLTINSGGVLNPASAWDGSTGGVIALDVRPGIPFVAGNGRISINGTGRIDASGFGFRPGALDNQSDGTGTEVATYRVDSCSSGGRKGESILGWAGDANGGTCGAVADNNETGSYGVALSGAFSRGALANGGGGGNSHNAGGGGGANGGAVASWNGGGNPSAGFAAAWALDDNTGDPNDAPTVTAASTSTGGGRGGYTFSGSSLDPTLVAPGCGTYVSLSGCNFLSDWAGHDRRNRGGLGGRPLDPRPDGVTDVVDRIYFGGGGGAGDGNNGANQLGGAGGGLIYLIAMSVDTDNGALTSVIRANGGDGLNTISGHNDAPGGGGGGGTIVALIRHGIDNEVQFSAVGGVGGSQTIGGPEAEGPGGGGGGGVVAASYTSGTPDVNVNGGANGLTTSSGVTGGPGPDFGPNGATRGGSGSSLSAPARNSQPLLCLQGGGGAFTTPVSIAYFKSEDTGSGVRFEFASSAEAGHLGYRLYAERAGRREAMGGLILAAKADSPVPQDYALTVPGSGFERFYLADVALDGRETLRGPFEPGRSYGTRPVLQPYNWSTARSELAAHQARNAPRGGTSRALVTASVRGMQRLTHEALVNAGVDLSGTPAQQIALIGRSGPVIRRVRGGAQFGPGSAIEFWAEPRKGLYSANESFHLLVDAASARDMETNTPLPLPAGTPSTDEGTSEFSGQADYSFSSPLADPFYATRALANGAPGQASFTLNANGAVSAEGRLTISLWGGLNYPQGALPDHHARIFFNNVLVESRRFDGLVGVDIEATVSNVLPGTNTVRVELPLDTGNPADIVNIESARLAYRRTPAFANGRYLAGGIRPAGTVSDQLFADGLGDPASGSAPINLPAITLTGLGASTHNFRIDNGQPTELSLALGRAIDAGALGESSLLWMSVASGLHVPQIAATEAPVPFPSGPVEYWVVTHGLFADALAPLLNLRSSQGLSVGVVKVEDLYARYTAGNPDPAAILRFVREHAAPAGARYLLLVGGDTTDAAGYLGTGSVSFVPAPYARTNEYVAFAPADPLYGDLTGDGVPEISVGRLPVRTLAEVQESVRKIVAFDTQPAALKVLAASGAQDGAQALNFSGASGEFRAALMPVWQSTVVDVDELGVDAARTQLTEGLNGGQSLVSYIGHSSPTQWGFESLLNSGQISGLPANPNAPVVLQFGCWTTYFVFPSANSMGHALMLTPNRGASAVIGSTVLLDQPNHDAMAAEIAPRLLPGTRVGDALLQAKRALAAASTGSLQGDEVQVGISILGDPAQPLR